MKSILRIWNWLKPVEVPPAPAWVAKAGWVHHFPLSRRYAWDRKADFDSWEDGAHWVRCLVEDQTPHNYAWLKMPPGEPFEYESPIGQVFRIERGI